MKSVSRVGLCSTYYVLCVVVVGQCEIPVSALNETGTIIRIGGESESRFGGFLCDEGGGAGFVVITLKVGYLGKS